MILIRKYVKNLIYKDFEKNIAVQDSVMRRFEVIGEASARLTEEFKKQHPEIPWRSMIGLRNIIVHDYSTVNLKEAWKIATIDLLKTLRNMEKILND